MSQNNINTDTDGKGVKESSINKFLVKDIDDNERNQERKMGRYGRTENKQSFNRYPPRRERDDRYQSRRPEPHRRTLEDFIERKPRKPQDQNLKMNLKSESNPKKIEYNRPPIENSIQIGDNVDPENKEEVILNGVSKYEGFDDMEYISDELLKGIFEYGFKVPSRIQGLSIDYIHAGRNVIAQSQSGTGKTGAFSIGLLTRINPAMRKPQAIVIANTRELASQIRNVVMKLSKYMGVDVALCVGNTDVRTNIREAQTSQVLVGTPGRLEDLINRKSFDIRKIKVLIMDEADVLLKDDFSDQVKNIVDQLDTSVQYCIFSATIFKAILDIANIFITNPVKILLEREELSLDLIRQYQVDVQYEEYKYGTLNDLYQNMYIGQCIIFINSINKLLSIEDNLRNDGHTVGIIHSGMTGEQRDTVIEDFRLNKIRVLLSTDVLSRGIDVQQVGMVINYDLPRDRAQYLHRIGRSGRFGKIGVAINFVTKGDMRIIRDLESFYRIKINDMPQFDELNEYLSGINGYHILNIT